MVASTVHAYKAPQASDARSPCPALNSLANHSYVPHDGRRIGFFTAVRALHHVYHVSWFLAALLTLGACYCSKGFSICLADLCQHDVIEHDGSLTRADTSGPLAGANADPERLESLLGASKDGRCLTLNDLCRVRYARDAALIKPLSTFHHRIAYGEVAFAYMTLVGQDGTVSVEDLRCWFGQDRIPDGWLARMKLDIPTVRQVVVQIRAGVAALTKN